jgi:C-terminal processing protease CtpA/Prc
MIIERLRRELALVDMARNSTPQTNPGAMVVGPKVLLADEFSASDGDLVTWRFKTLKIGPVIGKRTWGGVVGIAGTLPFLDGGVLNKPEFSRYDENGKWIMEGVGVEPDIMVDNDPAKEFAGDDQTDKAIESSRPAQKARSSCRRRLLQSAVNTEGARATERAGSAADHAAQRCRSMPAPARCPPTWHSRGCPCARVSTWHK